MKRSISCMCLVLVLLLDRAQALPTGQKRPLTPDDLLRLEVLDDATGISPIAISPDGQSVAYVVKRARATATQFGYYLNDWGHADVWLVSTSGGQPQNITNGASDNSGFWAPKWSPDGRRLAVLSTRGGNVRVWVWTRLSGRLQMLSDRGADLWLSSDLQWISDHELVFPVLPEGERHTGMRVSARIIAETIDREWGKAWMGREATASLLESGIPASMEGRPQSQMLVMDIPTGKQHVISTAPRFGTVRISPDRRYIAFLKQVGVWQPDPNIVPVKHLVEGVYQLTVTDVQDGLRKAALAGPCEVFGGSVLWSPDSTELAVIGYDANSRGEQEQVFRCKVAGGICRKATNGLLDLGLGARNIVSSPPFLWYGKHELLIHGRAENSLQSRDQPEQLKWWTVDAEGHVRNFFVGIKDAKKVPSQMLPEVSGTGLIALIEGSVWRISSDGHLIQNLTPRFEQKITSIEWPQSPNDRVGAELIFGVRRGTTYDLYRLDLRSGRVIPLPKPSPEARLTAYDSERGTSIFTANDRTGTYLWLKGAEKEGFTTVLETNTFLHEIGEGELKKIEYRGLDGQDLKAWIILPFGYQEGKRYPVVAWVYAGLVYGDDPPQYFTQINDPSPFNLQLLAAHGYVVLLPSMPLKSYGAVDDPYMELTKGVLPAVDKLIDLGIADPERLGVMGQSYGGYSTYGLITQTNRFKAAVALAGLSNLVSLYGILDARKRYRQFAHEDPFRMWNAETLYMGDPPWKDLGRYLRNSPINYVERVQTPLLIIQGDLDYIPMQQGEEFFTALYRQNKRATFVRYWGEEHVLDSPANIRDLWQRIYAWFDGFLKPEGK